MSRKTNVPCARVSLYLAAPTADETWRLVKRGLRVLAHEQLACAERFIGDADRGAYLLAHILLRAALSHRAPQVPPSAWQLAAGAYGKPELMAPAGAPPLRFNLTHTDGLVACVVSDGGLIGVDAEAIDDPGDAVEMAEHYFAPTEMAAMAALPAASRRERFFELWTLKESYLKARGLGLELPLDAFAFRIEPDEPVHVGFEPRIRDEPSRWQFVQRRPTPRHRLAVAIGNGEGASRRLVDEWVLDDIDEAGHAQLQAVDGAEGENQRLLLRSN